MGEPERRRHRARPDAADHPLEHARGQLRPRTRCAVVLAHELGHHSRNHLPEEHRVVRALCPPRGVPDRVGDPAPRGDARARRPFRSPCSCSSSSRCWRCRSRTRSSRNMEAEADWVALETTRDPDAARRLWQGFARQALADPSPPTWSYLLVDTHPSMAKRVAMVDAWRERNAP